MKIVCCKFVFLYFKLLQIFLDFFDCITNLTLIVLIIKLQKYTNISNYICTFLHIVDSLLTNRKVILYIFSFVLTLHQCQLVGYNLPSVYKKLILLDFLHLFTILFSIPFIFVILFRRFFFFSDKTYCSSHRFKYLAT